ncbi:MAG: glycosyltransferase [Devosia sp.]
MIGHLVLISKAQQTCGVEAFARLMAAQLGGDATTAVLGEPLPDAADTIINLPVVAWKRKLLAPILAAFGARLRRRDVTIVLHEWADLALARRISYLPLLPLATRVLFSSPEVMAQFAATPMTAVVTRRRAVLPIPPNLALPETALQSPLATSLAAGRAAGQLVLGQFGSIYPKKDPLALLEVAADLARRSIDVRLVFAGGFVGEGVEAEFRRHVERLSLGARVTVTGYIETAAELHGVLQQMDVLVYPLAEGLTSRRGSILAAALSGRPVVVTAPERPDSLDHHRLFQTLLGAGAIQLAPHGATPVQLADAVLAVRGAIPRAVDVEAEIVGLWADVTAMIEA